MENQEIKKIGRLLSQPELGLTVFASKDVSRYQMSNIHVTSKHTEATNGHFMCRVEKDSMDPEDFPVIENTGHDFDFEKGIDVCIPIDTLKSFKIPKKSTLPIFTYAKLSTNENQCYLASTDLKTTQIAPIPNLDITYPDVEQVLPHIQDGIQIGLSAEYLGVIADYVNKFGSRTKGIMFTIPKDYTNNTPVEFQATLENGQVAKGVIMPMKI